LKSAGKTVVIAWLIAAVYYFYQYMLRSAPAVMMPQMSESFGLTATAIASMVGLFYFGYSPFSLVAGAAMDRFGPRKVVPLGAAAVGVGALLFSTGVPELASLGRLLQGAGGVFALVGAIYIATNNFPASMAATLIGATQMFGMAGGSAGQFMVGPAITAGMDWSQFWVGMGIVGLLICILLFVLLPPQAQPQNRGQGKPSVLGAFSIVFRNPQSILCGVIAGLMFIPTTIFDMVWGVRYVQEGLGLDYTSAVLRSAAVPFGWIIGCPLLGFISDKIGRRKPVIIGAALVLLACFAWILFGPIGIFPPYILGLVAGIASGAAMLPYSVIKEANPSEVSGTATGVINFLNFTFSALLGPVFASLLHKAADGADVMTREHYQIAFEPLLYGIALAVILAFLLKETGTAARNASPTTASD
jgi:MFS family permease